MTVHQLILELLKVKDKEAPVKLQTWQESDDSVLNVEEDLLEVYDYETRVVLD